MASLRNPFARTPGLEPPCQSCRELYHLLLDRTADHDVTESDIMLAAGCPSSDADYQFDPDRLEAAQHVFSHAGG